MTLEMATQYSKVFISLSLIIATLEVLSKLALFKVEGMFSWKVSKAAYRWTNRGVVAQCLGHIFSFSGFRFLLIIQLAFGALLLSFSILNFSGQFVLISYLLFSWLLFMLRLQRGLDGSDQMTLVMLISLLLFEAFAGNAFIEFVVSLFLVCQLCLNYFTSGILKMKSSGWRSGKHLLGILSTETYGNESFYLRIKRYPNLAKVVSWTVILWETLFIIGYLIGPYCLEAFLVLGVLFHLSNAIVMRLNTFFWSFVSSYFIVMRSWELFFT